MNINLNQGEITKIRAMSSNNEEITEKVKQLILEILPDVSLEELSEDSDIFSMGLDSINAMTLVNNLQSSFDIQLDTSEITFENFQNIGAIAQFVKSKKADEIE